MYTCGEYTQFSLTDVSKFERWMRKWCKKECIPGRSMIVFNKEDLVVEGKHTEEIKDNQVFYYHALPNITLEYIIISDSMCVLTKVWENRTLSVMYNIPKKWHNLELWHAT